MLCFSENSIFKLGSYQQTFSTPGTYSITIPVNYAVKASMVDLVVTLVINNTELQSLVPGVVELMYHV